MFASSQMPRGASRQAVSSMYHQIGVETAVNTAGPHKLVALLFDGALAALAQARGALRAGQTELKGRAIGRAGRIVEEGLKAALDLQRGGPLAANLRDVYSYIGLRLIHANLHNDEAALDECVRLIEPLRDAWNQIAGHPAARGGAAPGAPA